MLPPGRATRELRLRRHRGIPARIDPVWLLIANAAGLGDVRQIGSGNIGATNVLRTGGAGWPRLTLLLDAAKGMSAVLVARGFGGGRGGRRRRRGLPWPCARCGSSSRGGKGVATFIGVLLALAWQVGVIFCAVWLLIAVARRMSSLSAITAAATAPIFAYVAWLMRWTELDGTKFAATAALLGALLIYNHRTNIGRLLNGTEPRIGSEKKPAT